MHDTWGSPRRFWFRQAGGLLLLRRTRRVPSAAAGCPLCRLGTVGRGSWGFTIHALKPSCSPKVSLWSLLTTDLILPCSTAQRRKCHRPSNPECRGRKCSPCPLPSSGNRTLEASQRDAFYRVRQLINCFGSHKLV